MMDKGNLLRCKMALYREFLNAKDGYEWTKTEQEIIYNLVLDEQVQSFLTQALKKEKKK